MHTYMTEGWTVDEDQSLRELVLVHGTKECTRKNQIFQTSLKYHLICTYQYDRAVDCQEAQPAHRKAVQRALGQPFRHDNQQGRMDGGRGSDAYPSAERKGQPLG